MKGNKKSGSIKLNQNLSSVPSELSLGSDQSIKSLNDIIA